MTPPSRIRRMAIAAGANVSDEKKICPLYPTAIWIEIYQPFKADQFLHVIRDHDGGAFRLATAQRNKDLPLDHASSCGSGSTSATSWWIETIFTATGSTWQHGSNGSATLGRLTFRRWSTIRSRGRLLANRVAPFVINGR